MTMYGWSFAARTPDEVTRLIRALSKHRYVHEADLRLHWTVDEALRDRASFTPHAEAFDARRKKEPSLEVASRDPSLWRPALMAEVIEALSVLWSPDDEGGSVRDRLKKAVQSTGLPPCEHAPFESDPESPPHPELILLDWLLFPVDELDTERHAGALTAMEDADDGDFDPSTPVHQEGPVLALPELLGGAPNGVLSDDFMVWSEGPYSYADYVFRGAAKAAKLVDAPVGYRDLDEA
jgi:hypothetical protein